MIAAEYGIKQVEETDNKIDIFYACVDPKLNEKGYIVPGLGDAGDRSYGLKLDWKEKEVLYIDKSIIEVLTLILKYDFMYFSFYLFFCIFI